MAHQECIEEMIMMQSAREAPREFESVGSTIVQNERGPEVGKCGCSILELLVDAILELWGAWYNDEEINVQTGVHVIV